MNYTQISVGLDILKSHHADLAYNKCNIRLFESNFMIYPQISVGLDTLESEHADLV